MGDRNQLPHGRQQASSATQMFVLVDRFCFSFVLVFFLFVLQAYTFY